MQLNKTENKKLNIIYTDIYNILTKDHRDIYFGLFLMMIGFLILAIFKKWTKFKHKIKKKSKNLIIITKYYIFFFILHY